MLVLSGGNMQEWHCVDSHIDQKLKRQQDVLLTPVYL